MQLTGNQVLNADSSTIWQMLMDSDVLAKIVPGISKLEHLDDNTFRSTIEMKFGPVSGSFNGNLQMEDLTDQKSFILKTQQNSKIGSANAAIKIELANAGDHKTQVSFNGDVKLSGLLANMGQRLIGSVANALTKQFFTNFEKELEKSRDK